MNSARMFTLGAALVSSLCVSGFHPAFADVPPIAPDLAFSGEGTLADPFVVTIYLSADRMTKSVWYSETKFTPNQDIHNNGTVLVEANSGHATYGLVRDAIGWLYESYEGEVRAFRQLDSFRNGNQNMGAELFKSQFCLDIGVFTTFAPPILAPNPGRQDAMVSWESYRCAWGWQSVVISNDGEWAYEVDLRTGFIIGWSRSRNELPNGDIRVVFTEYWIGLDNNGDLEQKSRETVTIEMGAPRAAPMDPMAPPQAIP